jgi:hypothetical protein
LEEIDFLFTNKDVNPVKLSKDLRKERKRTNRRESIVVDTGIYERRKSSLAGLGQEPVTTIDSVNEKGSHV